MKSRAGCLGAAMLAAVLLFGCNSTLFLNESFINQTTGEIFPLAPGDRANFVLVRCNNATDQSIEFVVTAERRVASEENPEIVEIQRITRRILTESENLANDVGVLFDCPIFRVGLGETLDQPDTEPGIFVGAEAVGAGGFGVPPNANPLNADFGNFDCGDTIVFRGVPVAGIPGGVAVAMFVLDDETQPTEVRLDTFVNARTFIEQQQPQEE